MPVAAGLYAAFLDPRACYGVGFTPRAADSGAAIWQHSEGQRAEKRMRIGVISDTHGHVTNTLAAVRMLEALQVAAVLHCGDIGAREIPKLLAAWPTHFVFGNCDTDPDALRAAIEQAGLVCYGRFGNIELADRRIALLHSDDARLFRRVCTSGDYDLVCYGHTHHAKQHREGKTLILNPGALYRATPHSIAIVELDTMEATIVPL
jgi:putative phosphoesterase